MPPPVYRPVPAASQQMTAALAAHGRLGAPPVYRPFAAASQLKPAKAPPVYRPVPAALQQKAGSPATSVRSGAPPVYRPFAATSQVKPPAVYRCLAQASQRAASPLSASARSGAPIQPKRWINAPLPTRRSGTVQMSAPAAAANTYQIDLAAATKMIEKPPYGTVSGLTQRSADSGVEEGEVGSYAMVQFLEKTGDKLTGDHQPSGAAVKEALREALHLALLSPLTRSQAKEAYKKAVTVVVKESWHILESRTYGGRNSSTQIKQDAADLYAAAVKDFQILEKDWRSKGWQQTDIDEVWTELHAARLLFFKTGELQAGTMD
jgi:hypothetical protein